MGDLTALLHERLSAREPRSARSELRPAAVLLPLVVHPDGYRLLLTRRSSRLRRQPGDIAFPGGVIDPRDATPLAAALRESHEEVGLAPDDVTLLGQLDERDTVTGFRITPFVGAVKGPYPFKPNHEVAELMEVPLEALRSPSALRVEKRRFPDGRTRDVFHYAWGKHDIWGITGRLVNELLELAGM